MKGTSQRARTSQKASGETHLILRRSSDPEVWRKHGKTSTSSTCFQSSKTSAIHGTILFKHHLREQEKYSLSFRPKHSLVCPGPTSGMSCSRIHCRETIFAAQLPRNSPHHGGNFERGKKCPLLWGEAI